MKNVKHVAWDVRNPMFPYAPQIQEHESGMVLIISTAMTRDQLQGKMKDVMEAISISLTNEPYMSPASNEEKARVDELNTK